MSSAASLHGLMRFLNRKEWRDAFEEIMEAHFLDACRNAAIGMEQIADVLGDAVAMTLWGCAFEDLLARDMPGGRNIVEDYLKRRGYKESASAKAYMKAIRRSVMSLYEVSDIVPGKSFLARDLIRGGEPVRVTERSGSTQLKPWDRLAVRIAPLAGGYQASGGALCFGLETSEKLIATLGRFEQRLESEMHDLADEIGAGPDAERLADIIANGMASGASLKVAAPIFTRIWLSDALDRVLNPQLAKLVNTDRDEIVFCTLTFPLASGASADAVCSTLAAVEDLRRDGDAFFNWIRPEGATLQPQPGVVREAIHSQGGRVLGSVEVGEAAVVVTTNSLERAERARAKLSAVLGARVGEPTLTTETPEEATAKRERAPNTEAAPATLVLPPDEERRLVHSCLDEHYRRTLDQGLPLLDGMTPRQAARTAAGREKVATWLKYLENQSRRRLDPGDPLATYDLGWLWTELGVAELRV